MEKLSIILEALSFFLVTIDLYGEIRLERLHQQLGELSATMHRRLKAGRVGSSRFLNVLSSVDFKKILVLQTLLVATFVTVIVFHRPFATWHPAAKIGFVAVIFGILLIEASTLIGWITFLAINALIGIVSVAEWALGKAKLSGMMLMAGTILFLISKALQWYAVSQSKP